MQLQSGPSSPTPVNEAMLLSRGSQMSQMSQPTPVAVLAEDEAMLLDRIRAAQMSRGSQQQSQMSQPPPEQQP